MLNKEAKYVSDHIVTPYSTDQWSFLFEVMNSKPIPTNDNRRVVK